MTQDPAQAAGRVVAGRYALLSELGRGGMGIVWLAEDRTIGRRVAVKELHLPDGVPPAERTVFEERVLREARAAGRLNDPGVVTVHDVAQEQGTTYIVMELIQATTLSDLVAEQGPLPTHTVARLAEQLLSALEAAHAAGVVHRDVKPSNIMVQANGRVKLTDFGVAQATDDPRLTTSGILVGSPVYMAPERLRGQDADPGSDLWALGAVLFFAVEGYTAFERQSTAAAMHAILTEVPYLTRCQGPLASVIMGLLNTTPGARPSADQVRALLAQSTATPPDGMTAPVSAGPLGGTMRYVPPAAHTPAPPRPRRTKLIVITAAVAALVLFAGGFATRLVTEQDGDRPPNMDETLTYGSDGFIREIKLNEYKAAGNCLVGRLDEGYRFTESQQVECDAPHDLQVYYSAVPYSAPSEYEKFPDVAYPDQATLFTLAESWCATAFDSKYLTAKAEEKEKLRYRAIVPAKRAWEDVRRFYCVLYPTQAGDQLDKSMVPLE